MMRRQGPVVLLLFALTMTACGGGGGGPGMSEPAFFQKMHGWPITMRKAGDP